MTTPTLSVPGKIGALVAFVASVPVGLLALVLSLPAFAISTSLFVAFVAFIGWVVAVTIVVHPYSSLVGTNVRPVSDERRRECERVCEEHGITVRGVRMADSFRRSYLPANVFGVLPWNRHLFVEPKFFEAYADEERTALLAQEAALAKQFYHVYSPTLLFSTTLAYFGVLAVARRASFAFPDAPMVPEVLFVVLLALGVWLGRRMVYRADRYAADTAGREALASALERLDETTRESDEDWGVVVAYSRLWTRPSPRDRLERLCGDASEASRT